MNTTSRSMTPAEAVRRNSRMFDVLAVFQSKPLTWIDVRTLAHVGGFAAWRTRVSEAREYAEAHESHTIVWNGQVKDSAYMYRPLAVARDASAIVAQQGLFG